MKIKFARFPWQTIDKNWATQTDSPKKYGWGKIGGLGRFGGGWDYKLGIMIGGNTIIIDVLVGSIRIIGGNKWVGL